MARSFVHLVHVSFGLRTHLTPRRSVLHKTRNYLITVSDQDGLDEALVEMGVLTARLSLERAVPARLVSDRGAAVAYLRGSFLAGGFVAEPRGDAHFEIVASTRPVAEAVAALLVRFSINARIGRRRGLFVIYVKSAQDILAFLGLVGAPQAAALIERERAVKLARNDTNRIVNAELANQRKATVAASSQTELVEAVVAEVGLESLPAALRDFCELRLAHPELSLRELGAQADPPLSKSAVYHRVRRLGEFLEEARGNGGA